MLPPDELAGFSGIWGKHTLSCGTKRRRRPVIDGRRDACVGGGLKMRVLGLALAGGLAVITSVAAHAVPLGSNMERLRMVPAPALVQAWGGCGWGWHPVPGHWSQWRGGWVPPHCAPNHYFEGRNPMGVGKAHTEDGVITAVGGLVRGLAWVRWR